MFKLKFHSKLHQIFLMFICFHIINSSSLKKGDKISEVLSALKEIAFSYYMRGKNIQYSSSRKALYSPEEATSQKINYMTCSKLVENVYKELLNITTPTITKDYINYAYHRKKNLEIIASTSLRKPEEVELTFKPPNIRKRVIGNATYKDIVGYLQPGDIMIHFINFTKNNEIVEKGHTMMVYDVYQNKTDALIMESTDRGESVKTKLKRFPIFLSKKNNSFLEPIGEEGTLKLIKLSEIDIWKNMNKKYYYTIIRFIQKDKDENAYLRYDSNFYLTDSLKNNESIALFPKEKDRIKFSHLYIEKTVDKHNNNIVQIGDKLIYKIRIKNSGDSDYKENLIVTEQLDPRVEYIENINKNYLEFNYDQVKKTLEFEIEKIQKGKEKIIEYSVEVKRGNPGEVISSVGKVGKIPSSTVKNIIGKNLDKYEQIHIKKIYEKLKDNYTYVNLINEVYNKSFNIDIGLNEFNIKNLINNSKVNDLNAFPSIIKSNKFSKIILTNHYSAAGNQTNEYKFKNFGNYTDPERRQDFIYPDLFQTGDILIYSNYFDYNYTYENGEYAYIYIDDKFVGNNPGLDENINRRNEFSAKYYKENNLTLLISDYDIKDEKWLETANLQTLFSKIYYVILRPSLYYNFTIKCEAGYFLNETKMCQRCPIGEISSKGAVKCEKCPAGTYENERKKCLNCSLGTFSEEGSGKCKICEEEDYYDKNNRYCTKCKKNNYLEEGTYECQECPEGYLSKIGSFYSNSCKKCLPGEYFSYSDGNCSPCPEGTYSNITNSLECSECPAGTYSEKGKDKCDECDKGFYSFDKKTCEKCPDGQYLLNGECTNCLAGAFSNADTIECTACEAGTFSEVGWGYCKKCSPGFFSDKGAPSCDKCPEGTVSGEGFAKCIPCPAGFYSSYNGDSCQVCPAGTFSMIGDSECF